MSESGKEQKVKGALMVGLAMVIKGSKDIDWLGQTRLTAQDLELIRKGIMSSIWYDKSLYERMGEAVYKVVGKSQPEGAYQFGHGIVAETLLKVYRGPLVSNEPKELFAKFAELYGTAWFNYGKAEFTPTSQGGILKVTDPDGLPFGQGFLAMLKGVFARMVKENQGKNVTIECPEEKLPAGQKITSATLNIRWE